MTLQQDPTHPDGVTSDDPRGGSSLARAKDRKAAAALQMRKAGADWDEVAQVIGYPSGRLALVATEKALEKELKTEESQKYMRTLAGQRLERLLRGVWTKAINPDNPEHLAAVDRARQLIDRHAKLYGLDAPTEYVVHNPTQQELEKWVSTVVSSSTPALEEADIFDIDVLDDDAASSE